MAKPKARKRAPRPEAPVVMLPGAERAIDGAKFVCEAAAGGAKSVMVVAFYDDRMDARIFGDGIDPGDIAHHAAHLLFIAGRVD